MTNPNAQDNKAANAKVPSRPTEFPAVVYKGSVEHKLVRTAQERTDALADGFSAGPPNPAIEAARAAKAAKSAPAK